MEQTILTRKELYDLVWKESMVSLSKRYAISDVGLRKICIRMEIPLPPNGYWMKVQFGKKVRQIPLPLNYKGEESVTLALRDKDNPAYNAGTISPRKEKITELERDSRLSFEVPEKLKRPDPLIALSRSSLREKKPDHWDYIGTVSCSGDALDIRVAKPNVTRALLLFDTVIKALKARGHSVELANQKTQVTVRGEHFEISLREKMRKDSLREGNWTRQVFYPKGILAFIVGGWYGREYKDGKVQLENQLIKILADLELSANERIELHLQHQKAAEERAEKERLARELQDKKEQDLLNFKKLLTDSERWHKAENLRSYIRELESRMKNNPSLSTERLEWLAWAKRKADWYDPFIEIADELLADVNQNTLELPQREQHHWWTSGL